MVGSLVVADPLGADPGPFVAMAVRLGPFARRRDPGRLRPGPRIREQPDGATGRRSRPCSAARRESIAQVLAFKRLAQP